MSGEAANLFAVGDGVNTCGLVGAGTVDFAVLGHDDSEDLVAESTDGSDLLGVLGVPDPDILVASAGDDLVPVGAKSDAEDGLTVAVEGDE